MEIAIQGMHCEACVRRVKQALEAVRGVRVERVEVGSATIAAEPETQAAALEAIRKAGYEPHIRP
jgi:copper chaperone CopZ